MSRRHLPLSTLPLLSLELQFGWYVLIWRHRRPLISEITISMPFPKASSWQRCRHMALSALKELYRAYNWQILRIFWVGPSGEQTLDWNQCKASSLMVESETFCVSNTQLIVFLENLSVLIAAASKALPILASPSGGVGPQVWRKRRCLSAFFTLYLFTSCMAKQSGRSRQGRELEEWRGVGAARTQRVGVEQNWSTEVLGPWKGLVFYLRKLEEFWRDMSKVWLAQICTSSCSPFFVYHEDRIWEGRTDGLYCSHFTQVGGFALEVETMGI